MSITRFATRLNSFASSPHTYWPELKGKPSMLQMAERASTAQGLTDLDLNYPDHVSEDPQTVARQISDLGLSINGWRCATTPIRPSSLAPSQILTKL